MLLDQLLAELQTCGTVTVEWRPFADLHFPGRNGMAHARKWASKHGFVLMFIQPGERDRPDQKVKATFYRAIPRHTARV
jgi:hypothetical protein